LEIKNNWQNKNKWRRLSCKTGDNTVEGLIAAHKWPQGGIKELDDAAEREMQWARDMCANRTSLRDPTVYNYFMQLLTAKFYTGALLALLLAFVTVSN
jgi:hypothetical protein